VGGHKPMPTRELRESLRGQEVKVVKTHERTVWIIYVDHLKIFLLKQHY